LYRDQKVLAVVPARGGSKGVPRKNLRPVLGIPIVCRAGLCALEIPEIDRVVISTDDDEIGRVGEKYGLSAPFRRPKEISGDDAGDWEVLNHALVEMEAQDSQQYDVVVMLQPTSPLRRNEDVVKTIKKLIDGEHDAVWTVTETDLKYHPTKQMHVREGRISYVMIEGEAMLPRQALEPVFHVNGVAYALTRTCILEQGSRLGADTAAYVVDSPSVSIDTLDDFDTVTKILEKMTVGNGYETSTID
jgi:CMP-N,N'-diacetyllegionaminic acid synthase